jgi:hypothetical protein
VTHEAVSCQTRVHPFLPQAFQVRLSARWPFVYLFIDHTEYRYMPEEDSVERAAGLAGPSVAAAYATAGGGYQHGSSYQGSTD